MAGNCLLYHQPEFLATKGPKQAKWLSGLRVAHYLPLLPCKGMASLRKVDTRYTVSHLLWSAMQPLYLAMGLAYTWETCQVDWALLPFSTKGSPISCLGGWDVKLHAFCCPTTYSRTVAFHRTLSFHGCQFY